MALFDIFRPKWKHSKWEVRKKAVQQLGDQNILSEIAKTDSHPNVREKAVQRLKDRDLLTKIEKTDSHPRVRQTVKVRIKQLDLLKDQNILAEILKEDLKSRNR